ncbi:MAG: tRNA (N6-threonylcarbamoyladenosine(37)-N6)-methyltransferase TrmO [Candidatus Promineifilaceae bacterium]
MTSSNLQAVFTQVCGDFWDMLLRSQSRLLHEQFWLARHDFQAIILPRLMVLLRISYGAVDNWLAGNPADGIEAVLNEEELARLRECIPDRDDRDLARALRVTAEFGAETCAKISEQQEWDWPRQFAQETLALLSPGLSEINSLPALYLKPIGIVRSSVNELLRPDEIKSVPAEIIVDPALSPGLDGLIGNQRLLVIFQFHKLSGYELHQHPRGDKQRPKEGVFALHSPHRPNPIGVTEVDLIRREGNILHVRGLDAVNGTPVLDLKLNRVKN